MNETVVIDGVPVTVYTHLPIDAEHDDSQLAEQHREHANLAFLAAPPARLEPNQKRKARGLITKYCEQSIATAASKHYSQHRPMTHLGLSPDAAWTADCSGHVTGAFFWADRWTPFKVDDPNGLGYSGFGYTGTLLGHNFDHRVPDGRKYFVGDLGLYGPASATRHVVTCFKGGDRDTSLWASHGSESGPYPVRLRYRTDFLCVVRPRSLL